MPSRVRTTRKYLEDAPLALVLCGITVPQVLTIENHIPRIQEFLRRRGFPRFEKQQIQQLQFTGSGANVATESRFVFSDRSKTQFAVVTSGSVSFEALAYTGFEDFLDSLKPVVDAFKECVQPEFYERIGLRYVNRIDSPDPEDAYKYFDRRILSFESEALGISRILLNNHLQGSVGNDTLQIRFSQVENSPALPLDLLGPEFQDLGSMTSGVHSFLDLDSYVPKASDFGWKTIEEDLWRLHEHTEQAFWLAISPEAQHEWKLKILESGSQDV